MQPTAATHFTALGLSRHRVHMGPKARLPRLAQPLLDSSSAAGSWPLALPCCREKAGELVFILALQLVFFSEPQFPPS